MPKVTCGDCRKHSEIGAPADVWKCPDCGELNAADGAEDNSNTQDLADQEAASLEARLLELRGGVAPNGDTNV